MPHQQIINQLLEETSLPPLRATTPVSGGSINSCYHCQLDDGRELFAKINTEATADFFAVEAEGLRALADNTPLRIPAVIQVSEHCLLLEYLPPGPADAHYWEVLASGLAQLHREPQPAFGFNRDNYCGQTRQLNGRWEDGYQFFAEQRLGFQARLAQSRGLLTIEDCRNIETLGLRLPEWIPEESPRLLHGDLWSGNIHTDAQGRPVLLDPACYWGWREADLAMTRLFGALPDRFYDCYHEHLPLQPGWQERMALYNLYHLLNHLNLFGDSYLPSIRAVLRRHVG